MSRHSVDDARAEFWADMAADLRADYRNADWDEPDLITGIRYSRDPHTGQPVDPELAAHVRTGDRR